MNKIDRPSLRERELLRNRLMQSTTKEELRLMVRLNKLKPTTRTKLAMAEAVAASATHFGVVYQLPHGNCKIA